VPVARPTTKRPPGAERCSRRRGKGTSSQRANFRQRAQSARFLRPYLYGGPALGRWGIRPGRDRHCLPRGTWASFSGARQQGSACVRTLEGTLGPEASLNASSSRLAAASRAGKSSIGPSTTTSPWSFLRRSTTIGDSTSWSGTIFQPRQAGRSQAGRHPPEHGQRHRGRRKAFSGRPWARTSGRSWNWRNRAVARPRVEPLVGLGDVLQ
jgi:hypothetical protein